MAEVDGTRYVENPAGEQLSPGGEEAQGQWQSPRTPGSAKGFEHHDYDHDHQHAKKSMLAKIKEKAMKWKHMLAKKKHGHDKDNVSPRLGISLKEEGDFEEKDPEYHGAPMYESEKALDATKEATLRTQAAVARAPAALKKSRTHRPSNAVTESEMKHSFDTHRKPELHHLDAIKLTSFERTLAKQLKVQEKPKMRAMATKGEHIKATDDHKTISEIVSEILAHAYLIICGAAHKIASKIPLSPEGTQAAETLLWAKGASLLQYLMHKLQPREEDRALMQLITEYASKNEVSQTSEIVLVKVKGTLGSLLRRERMTAAPGPSIPLSTYPHTVEARGSRCDQTSTN